MEIGPIGCGTTRTEKGLLIFKLPPYISSMLYLLLLSGPSFHCVRKSIETGNKPEISQPSHHPISYNVVVDNWFPSLDICRLLRWVSLGWEWSVWYLYSRNYDGQAVEGHQNPVTGNWCRSLCVCVYVCVCVHCLSSTCLELLLLREFTLLWLPLIWKWRERHTFKTAYLSMSVMLRVLMGVTSQGKIKKKPKS